MTHFTSNWNVYSPVESVIICCDVLNPFMYEVHALLLGAFTYSPIKAAINRSAKNPKSYTYIHFHSDPYTIKYYRD